jgi:hypothetical protein
MCVSVLASCQHQGSSSNAALIDKHGTGWTASVYVLLISLAIVARMLHDSCVDFIGLVSV